MSHSHHRHRRKFVGETDRAAFLLRRDFLKASNPNSKINDDDLRCLPQELRQEIYERIPLGKSAADAPAAILSIFEREKIRPSRRTVKKIFELAAMSVAEQSTSTLLVVMHKANKLGLPLPQPYLEAVASQSARIVEGGHRGHVYKFAQSLAESDAISSFYLGQDIPSLQKDLYKECMGSKRFADLILYPPDEDKSHIAGVVYYWFEHREPANMPHRFDEPSNYEGELSRVLERAGAKRLSDVRTPVTGHRFDLTMAFLDKDPWTSARTVFVEADGPEHLLRSTDGQRILYDGKTAAQTAMRYREIQRIYNGDATILRVPSNVFVKCRRDRNFWQQVVRMVNDGASGCLMADAQRTLLPMGRLGQLANAI